MGSVGVGEWNAIDSRFSALHEWTGSPRRPDSHFGTRCGARGRPQPKMSESAEQRHSEVGEIG